MVLRPLRYQLLSVFFAFAFIFLNIFEAGFCLSWGCTCPEPRTKIAQNSFRNSLFLTRYYIYISGINTNPEPRSFPSRVLCNLGSWFQVGTKAITLSGASQPCLFSQQTLPSTLLLLHCVFVWLQLFPFAHI